MPGFLDFPFKFCFAWFVLVPLFVLVRTAKTWSALCLEVFVCGMVFNLISFQWLSTIHPLDWQGFNDFESIVISALAWFLPSIVHSIYLLFFALIAKLIFAYSKPHNFVSLFLIAFAWLVIFHKLLPHFPVLEVFTVPINQFVYSQFENTTLIQIASAIGALGLEFFLIFSNLLLADLFQENRNVPLKELSKINLAFDLQRENLLIFVGFIFLLLSMATHGFLKLQNDRSLGKEPKRASYTIVQANLAEKDIRGKDLNPGDVVDKHIQLSDDLRSDILLWAEGTVPSANSGAISKKFFERFHTEKPFKVFIYGTYFSDSDKTFNSVRVHEFDTWEINSSYYNKIKLVPFGEYTPFINLLPSSLKNLARSVVGNGFASGDKNQEAISTNFGKIGFCICFEMLFPELLRKQVLSGAEYLVNLSDLSWFKTNQVKKQFLAAAVFRAVENNRDLLIAANSGYSVHIDFLGRVRMLSPANSVSRLEGELYRRDEESFYSLYGW